MRRYIVITMLICNVLFSQEYINEYVIPNFKKLKDEERIIYNNIVFQFTTNKRKVKTKQKDVIVSKTMQNIFEKNQENTCKTLLLFAIRELQQQAIAIGGKRIINIKSYIDNQSYSNAKKFKCKVGTIFSIVTLKADIM